MLVVGEKWQRDQRAADVVGDGIDEVPAVRVMYRTPTSLLL